MKKTTLAGILSVLMILLPMSVSAATATASLTGPSIIRAGNTLTVSMKMNGTNLKAVQGEIQYDSAQLTYQSSAGVLTGWAVDINSSTAGKVKFLAADDKLTAPISSLKQVFTLTFLVKSAVATGATINVTATKLSASDGSNDFTPGDATYSVTVAAPASTNNSLATLVVSNAEISPTFSAATTSYTATVPFSISRLNITATAADAKAKVVVDDKSLLAGGKTNVNITVTAESGAKKTYTIAVTREKDPNYTSSTISTLADLKVEGFLLSPIFNTTETKYVVWLPTETESIAIAGTPTDSKASVEITGNQDLVAGQDNTVTVVCIAEDGMTKTEYTLIAWRAPAHDGASATPTSAPTAAESTPEPSMIPTATPTTDPGQNTDSEDSPALPIVGAGILGLVVGSGGSFLIKRRK
jgi:hypothetical protein